MGIMSLNGLTDGEPVRPRVWYERESVSKHWCEGTPGWSKQGWSAQ